MKKKYKKLFVFFLSGTAALIYEVAWIKPITTVFQSTTYVVAIILASFMFGLALGSAIIAKFIDKIRRPLVFYAFLEIGIGMYCLLLLGLFGALPFVFEKLSGIHSPFSYNLIQFFSVFFLLLVPTALMGATFPAIAKSYIQEEVGKGIGEVYSANNLGAIIGSLLAGFILIPGLGIRYTIVIAAFLNISAAFFVLFNFDRNKFKILLSPVLILFLVFSFYGNYSLERLYTGGVCGLFKKDFLGDRKILFYEEGHYGNVVVLQEGMVGEIKRLLVNGQGSSSLRLSDVRVSTLLGYLPILIKPNVSTALIIGFGTGATSNILSRHMKATTVEIELKVIKAAGFFKMINEGVLTNKNHNIIYDDARHYLLKTRGKFDIIINHPLAPYQSFSSLLFTKEFFGIVKNKLNESGLYVQWFPVYYLKPGEFKDFYNTFNSIFPYQVTFVNLKGGENIEYIIKGKNTIYQTHDNPKNSNELIIIGSQQPIVFDKAALEKNLNLLTEYDKSYLKLTSLDSAEKIYNLLLFKGEDIKDYYKYANFITDDRPNLEFSTPLNYIKEESPEDSLAMDDVLNYLDSTRSVNP